MKTMMMHGQKHGFLAEGVGYGGAALASVAALLLLVLPAAVFGAVACPSAAPPEPALFTAYLPPAEEHCCTFCLPGGRIGFGFISIPCASSVFVVDSTPRVTRYTSCALCPEAVPAPDILPIFTPAKL